MNNRLKVFWVEKTTPISYLFIWLDE